MQGEKSLYTQKRESLVHSKDQMQMDESQIPKSLGDSYILTYYWYRKAYKISY